jgi:glycosyltransferase involved in cell wall biosynthesis
MLITIITPRFSYAGVPLAQIRFAKALANRGHKVTLIIGYVDFGYDLPKIDNVDVCIWNKKKVTHMFLDLILYFLKNPPQIIFSAEDHLNIVVLLAAIFSGVKSKISCSSRVTPIDTYFNKGRFKGQIMKYLMRLVAWRATALTCVSKDMVKQYKKIFPKIEYTCVYNIVKDKDSLTRMTEVLQHEWFDESIPVIVAAGRLAPWKGFDNLINAFELVRKKKICRLVILGDGPERKNLQNQINYLGLEDSIQLLGYVENPLKYFYRANIFVLSSRLEGMPNVLVEAIMCGCIPIATNCPTGPSEILGDQLNGFLVPVDDPGAMAKAICLALDKNIDLNLLNKVVDLFDQEKVLDRHFDLLGVQG